MTLPDSFEAELELASRRVEDELSSVTPRKSTPIAVSSRYELRDSSSRFAGAPFASGEFQRFLPLFVPSLNSSIITDEILDSMLNGLEVEQGEQVLSNQSDDSSNLGRLEPNASELTDASSLFQENAAASVNKKKKKKKKKKSKGSNAVTAPGVIDSHSTIAALTGIDTSIPDHLESHPSSASTNSTSTASKTFHSSSVDYSNTHNDSLARNLDVKDVLELTISNLPASPQQSLVQQYYVFHLGSFDRIDVDIFSSILECLSTTLTFRIESIET